MHWVWIVGEWIVGIFDLWVPTIYINPINDLWESIKQEAYWLALWCCSSFPVSLGCSSFNQKRWDSSLSEEHCEISFTSDKVECSVVTLVLGPISGKADISVFLFHFLGLALTSCSWLQIEFVINNSSSPVDFPNLLVEFSYACLSGMIACNGDHVKSYWFYKS